LTPRGVNQILAPASRRPARLLREGDVLARASRSVFGLLVPGARGAGEARPSIVGEGTRVAGDLMGEGDVQVDGCVDGDVRGRCVTVGANGRVLGRIVAEAALVSGSVSGGIAAHTVVLTGTARVTCDIVQERLTVEAGAQVAGVLERPDLRVPRPAPEPPEIVLIERVLWTRRNAERWVSLGAETVLPAASS
jgi:cytoskeletal protein CcmA (bactofilin family)